MLCQPYSIDKKKLGMWEVEYIGWEETKALIETKLDKKFWFNSNWLK